MLIFGYLSRNDYLCTLFNYVKNGKERRGAHPNDEAVFRLEGKAP